MTMIIKGNASKLQAELKRLVRIYGAKEKMAVIIADSKLNYNPIMAQALRLYINA